MNHELFGELVYSKRDECWKGSRPLSHLAVLAKSRFGDAQEQPPPGMVPIRIHDFDQAGPSPQQEAGFRQLIENEQASVQAVLAALWRSYEVYFPNDRWRPAKTPQALTQLAQLTGVEIAREHHHGQAYLIFDVDCDWEIEHGMYVVYHKDKPPEWTTSDGLSDLLESDEPVREEEPPPPNQELVNAILSNDHERVAALQAQGHNINDVGKDPMPPLCFAVDGMNVDLVKRFLAAGADPNLKDFENRTPLQRARKLLQRATLLPRKREGWFMRLFMALARMLARRAMKEVKTRMEEIIRLLEAAGGK